MTRTRHLLGAAAIAAGLALAAPAGAAVITATEPPDFSNGIVLPSVLGALGIGVNTISGGIACSGVFCGAGDVADVFQVSLAAGLRVTSISLSVSSMFLSGLGRGGQFETVAGSLEAQTGILVQDFSADLAPTPLFAGAAAGPGDLVMRITPRSSPIADATVSFSYVVGITVEAIQTNPVPEPATLALLGAGLLGLAATRRRATAAPR